MQFNKQETTICCLNVATRNPTFFPLKSPSQIPGPQFRVMTRRPLHVWCCEQESNFFSFKDPKSDSWTPVQSNGEKAASRLNLFSGSWRGVMLRTYVASMLRPGIHFFPLKSPSSRAQMALLASKSELSSKLVPMAHHLENTEGNLLQGLRP